MAAVQNNAMISHKLQYALGASPSYNSWEVGLFIASTISPACTDAASVYTTSTAECSISGYARAQLPYSAWSGGIASCVYSVSALGIPFSFATGGQTLYGHFLYDQTSGTIGWAEVWAIPFTVPSGGGSVALNLIYAEKQCS